MNSQKNLREKYIYFNPEFDGSARMSKAVSIRISSHPTGIGCSSKNGYLPRILTAPGKGFIENLLESFVFTTSYLNALHASRAMIAFLRFWFDFAAILAAKFLDRSISSFFAIWIRTSIIWEFNIDKYS